MNENEELPHTWGTKEVVLTKMKAIMVSYLSDIMATEVFSNIELSNTARFMANEWAMRIRMGLFGKETEVKTISYPKDWWQAFKERWFPLWVKARWPVVYIRATFYAREFYPKIALPNEEFHVSVFTRVGSDDEEET